MSENADCLDNAHSQALSALTFSVSMTWFSVQQGCGLCVNYVQTAGSCLDWRIMILNAVCSNKILLKISQLMLHGNWIFLPLLAGEPKRTSQQCTGYYRTDLILLVEQLLANELPLEQHFFGSSYQLAFEIAPSQFSAVLPFSGSIFQIVLCQKTDDMNNVLLGAWVFLFCQRMTLVL